MLFGCFCLNFHKCASVVSRIVAQSEKRGVALILDVNTEIYPMHEKEKFLMVLSPTLNWSGAPVAGKQGQVLYYTFEVNLESGRIKIMSILNGRKFHPQIHV